MRKFNLAFAVVVLTALFVACSESTKEELIEKAFKEYVNKNFDDPNSLKEIISIEIEDTLSTTKTEAFITGIFNSSDSLFKRLYFMSDSLGAIHNSNFEKIKSSYRLTNKYRGDSNVLKMIADLLENTNEEFSYKTSSEYQELKIAQASLNNALDSLKKDSTFIVTYKVRTRVLQKDGLKIMDYYAQLSDKSIIEIFDNNNLSSYPTLYSEAYENADIYTQRSRKLLDILLERVKIYRDLIAYMTTD